MSEKLLEATAARDMVPIMALLHQGANPLRRVGNFSPFQRAWCDCAYTIIELFGSSLIRPLAEWEFEELNRLLYSSCVRQDWRAMRLLKDAGANPDMYNGMFPVMQKYAREGDRVTVRELLSIGASAGPNLGDMQPLRAAAERGHVGVVRALLAAGAEVDYVDSELDSPGTALTMAAGNGHIGCMKILVAAGANLNGNPEHTNLTPLARPVVKAALYRQWDAVDWLLKRGAENHPEVDKHRKLARQYRQFPNLVTAGAFT